MQALSYYMTGKYMKCAVSTNPGDTFRVQELSWKTILFDKQTREEKTRVNCAEIEEL